MSRSPGRRKIKLQLQGLIAYQKQMKEQQTKKIDFFALYSRMSCSYVRQEMKIVERETREKPKVKICKTLRKFIQKERKEGFSTCSGT